MKTIERTIGNVVVIGATGQGTRRFVVDCPRGVRELSLCRDCVDCHSYTLSGDGPSSVHCAFPGKPNTTYGTVASAMERDVVCVRTDVQLASVVALLDRHAIESVPVLDDHDRPVATISKAKVGTAVTVQESELIATALASMREHRADALMVVDDEGRICGVLRAHPIGSKDAPISL